MGNPFVHVELISNDGGKAKTFYGELFDWKLEDVPTLGATVMKEPTEVMGAGSFTIITDPTGAMLGLWEPKKA